MTAVAPLPAFTLRDLSGAEHAFPTGKHSLLVFLKEDCPTCRLSLPLIQATDRAFAGDALDVLLVGQDRAGNERLVDDFSLLIPMLDDSELRVSYRYELDTVPTIILADAGGSELERFVGFAKSDWRALHQRLTALTGEPAPEVDWDGYPETRPGCGSKSVEPGIAERLAAEAEGSPIRARRIEIGESDDPFEFMFDQGLTDGLPVIPPTRERVLRMLSGTKRDAQEILGLVPPNLAPVTVEKIAINAVMAGCKPEYMPVVLAAVEAILDEQFNMHGVLATTHFPTPVIIVNGPIRDRIGMNYRMNALGQGNRANATIGRAVQLVVRNVGGGRPGEVDRAALGQPGKYTFCFAEFEERSNWEPLHVERGFQKGDSVVTVFAGNAPTFVVDQLARNARALCTSFGRALTTVSHPKQYNYGEIVLIVPPEHVDTIAQDGWGKAQVRRAIQEATFKPVRELVRSEDCAEGIPPVAAERLGMDTVLPKFAKDENITLVVAGGEAGKFAAYLGGWVSGPMGSIMTSKLIRD
ncbi:MAG TPA: TlpA disulfide reductase family protein [Tepidiformaceae bacterium]|nr:TlpA disulfide reductase family protein [Tepidiformaceae bacterium]